MFVRVCSIPIRFKMHNYIKLHVYAASIVVSLAQFHLNWEISASNRPTNQSIRKLTCNKCHMKLRTTNLINNNWLWLIGCCVCMLCAYAYWRFNTCVLFTNANYFFLSLSLAQYHLNTNRVAVNQMRQRYYTIAADVFAVKWYMFYIWLLISFVSDGPWR